MKTSHTSPALPQSVPQAVLLWLFVAAVLSAAVSMSTAPTAAYAAPESTGRQDLSPLDGEIPDKRAEAERVRRQVGEIDQQTSQLVEEYNQAQYFLERAIADEQAAAERVQRARTALEEAQDRLMGRLSNVYRRGPLGVLDLLFGDDDMGGLTQRIRYFQAIVQDDRERLDEVTARKAELEREQASLEREREKRADIAADLERRRAAVEEKLEERRQVLASVEADLADLIEEEKLREEERARIAAAEAAERARRQAEEEARRRAEEEARREAIAAAERTTTVTASSDGASPEGSDSPESTADRSPGATTAPNAASPATDPPTTAPPTTAAPAQPDTAPAPSSKGARIIQVANQYLGVPYVWAGESPSGFDCSGLTKYVLAKVGVRLPHSSRLQSQMGAPVGRSQLQAGDLVFFGNPVHHVGIYAGGGQYIHAPYTGEVVKYSPFNRSDFAGGRRF